MVSSVTVGMMVSVADGRTIAGVGVKGRNVVAFVMFGITPPEMGSG
jgi:hypothetical protein